ncbi:phosphate:nucleotide phosphotransferase [Flavobacterium akiainvivens]|uniref:Phosphate:nucleotide phosphotransferase n=1 Tax=Flavobacterium akiainvivens TaxID=1202724 RepID=A0A0M9VIB3_9FLAO|nr:PPK2 family polyphosphate kinase [Flavobacterium akiainvivens]KOS06232.1 phosphate:nucleotide phosphotransferase [Flavobacterium akiainvivens]SFQ18327.1 polyphosphate:nucleotide phosphotransferase, PPK2 family [Flavobacterium akiainvivens]
MKALHPEDFKVTSRFAIAGCKTSIGHPGTHDELKEALGEVSKQLGKLQDKMYANNRYSVLIVLQGMDTSGKDSLIKQVFKNFNARGVNVFSFKQPTALELKHDYLWRHYVALPERGKFAVFNRSHYENVLVTRVHPDYLLKENLPGIEAVGDIPADFWAQRFKQINDFERHVAQNGTVVLKFFLNISKEEQRQRLLRRLNLKNHNWKFSPADLDERQLWDEYQKYYEEAINHTSTAHAPWYCIPADSKKTARLLVAKAILHELEKYDFHEPEVDETVLENINAYKRKLESEDGR